MKKRPNRSTERATSNVPVGRIAGVFGLAGELKCDPTSAGRTLFFEGAELECARAGESAPVRIVGVRPHQGRLLIRIAGVDDPEAAKAFAGAVLRAPRERIALEAGEYWDSDLVGCAVFGVDGREYGQVSAVEHYPASDMLVVAGTMLPMVAAYVRAIDLGEKRITIDPPAGLFD